MKTYTLLITSALVITGAVYRAGDLVEINEIDAKQILARGKATLADEQPNMAPEDIGASAPINLGRLNKAKLTEMAVGLGIDVTDAMTNKEIINAIESKEGGA